MWQFQCSNAETILSYMHIIYQSGYYVVIYALYMQWRRGAVYLQYKPCRQKFQRMSLDEKEGHGLVSTTTTCYVVIHASYICSPCGVLPVYDNGNPGQWSQQYLWFRRKRDEPQSNGAPCADHHYQRSAHLSLLPARAGGVLGIQSKATRREAGEQ